MILFERLSQMTKNGSNPEFGRDPTMAETTTIDAAFAGEGMAFRVAIEDRSVS